MKILLRIPRVVLFTLLSISSFAQTVLQEPKALSDESIAEQLQADLDFRNTDIGKPEITWWDCGYGYCGTFSRADDFMARYDNDGGYIQTLVKKDWNDKSIPVLIKSLFNQSAYKSFQVVKYWEVFDVGQSGGYWELQDDKNKISRVWMNNKGKLSTVPLDTGINK